MDTQGSSFLKPLSEVHIDIRLEATATENASQDYLRITNQSKTEEFHIEVSSEGTATDKTSQHGRKPTLIEAYLRIKNQSKTKDASSEGTATAKAQEGHGPTEVTQTAKVNGNYRELFEAAVDGNWEAAEKIFDEDDEAMTAEIMTVEKISMTVLEVAARAAQDQFVEKLVKRSPQQVKFRNAIKIAARVGRIRMIKALLGADPDPKLIVHALWVATSWAPMQKELIWYLAKSTKSMPNKRIRKHLIVAGHLDVSLYLARRYHPSATDKPIENMELLEELAKMKSYFHSGARLNFWENYIYECIPLCLISTLSGNDNDKKMAEAEAKAAPSKETERKATTGVGESEYNTSLWNLTTKLAPFIKRIGESKWRHKCSLDFTNLALTGKAADTKMTDMKATDTKTPQILKFLLAKGILLDAASRGISEIVGLCLKEFPELRWEENILKALMIEVVNGRHVELFRLVNAYNRTPKLSDSILTDRKLVEAVVRSPGCVPADVSGTAFLMQRELQWYKVLEDRSDPFFRSLKFKVEEDTSNPSFKQLKFIKTTESGGKTYREIFEEQRQDLLRDAGQWMKDTSSSCSLVATLIITIAFAAAFTVPGGTDGITGIPIFQKNFSFMVFAIADAVALFSSVTATLMFLAILTSRYAIEDFLHSLPRKMVLGLTFLFLSLACMLMAFGSALTIVLKERVKWIYIPIILLAAFPGVLFLILQLPLYAEMVNSTFWPRLYRPLKLQK